MADAAAARREARRRRILENSHNRLQLITGKSVESIRQESPSNHIIPGDSYDAPASVPEELSFPSLDNGVFTPELDTLGLLSGSRNLTAAGDRGESHAVTSASGVDTDTKNKSLLEKLVQYKYDIVLLSFLIQLLYSCSLFTLEETYFFLPLVMYDVTKMIWFPTQGESKLVGVLLLLNGMSGARAQRVLGMYRVMQEIIQDSFIYLFTTICIQSLLITMSLKVT